MSEPGLHDTGVEERRRDYGRALRIGLGVSAAAHLLVIFGLARLLSLDPAIFRAPAQRAIELQGLPVVQVDEVLPADETEAAELLPATEEQPPDEDELDDRGALPGPVAPPAAGRERTGAPRLTNAERLQPQEGDERLWRDFEGESIPEYLASNPYAEYEGEIRARLGVILDSLALSDEEYRRAREWLTGEEGHEWGVSPAGIHIGGVVIPINLGELLREQGPAGRESRQELSDLQAIQLQDMIDEAEEIRRERARQMRERTKEELERRARDSLEAAGDSP